MGTIVVVVLVGIMRYGLTSGIVGSTGWAFAVKAKTPIVKHRAVAILVIVRICRLSGRAGTNVFNSDVLRGSRSILVDGWANPLSSRFYRS